LQKLAAIQYRWVVVGKPEVYAGEHGIIGFVVA